MRRRSGTQQRPHSINELQQKYARPQRLLDSRSKNQQEIPSGLQQIQRIMKVQSIQEKQHRIFTNFKKDDQANSPSPRRKIRKTSYYETDQANEKLQDQIKQVNSPITLLKSEKIGERFSDKKKYGKSSDINVKKIDGSGNLRQSRQKQNKSNIYADDKLSHSEIVQDEEFKKKIGRKSKIQAHSPKIQYFSPKMCDSSHQQSINVQSPTMAKSKKMYTATVTNQRFEEKMKQHYFDSKHTSQKGSQIQDNRDSSLIDSRKGGSPQTKPVAKRRQEYYAQSPRRNRDLQQIKQISSSKHVSENNRNRKYSFNIESQSGKTQLDKLYKLHKNHQNLTKRLAIVNSSLDVCQNEQHWQQIKAQYFDIQHKLIDLQGQIQLIINMEQNSPTRGPAISPVMTQKVENLKKQNEQLTEENKRINQKYQRLMQQYAFAKQNIDQINKDKQDLVRELHQQHKITLSKSQVPDQMKKRIDALEQQNRGYINQVAILNDYIKNLGEQNKKLKKQFESLKQSQVFSRENLSQIKKLRGLLKQRQSELEMIRSSPGIASEANSLESDQLILLSQDLKQSKQQIEKLKKNAKAREQQQKQLFEAKINDLENQIKISVVSLEEKNNELEVQLNKAKTELRKKPLETSLQEVKRLQLQKNQKNAEIERLTLALKRLQKQFEQQNNQIIKPQNEKIISLQQQVSHQYYQIQQMEAQLMKLNQLALASTASLEKQKCVDDSDVINLLKQQNERLINQTKQKQSTLDNLLQQMAKKKNDLNHIKRQLIEYKGYEEQVKNVNQLLEKKQKQILQLKKQLSDKYQQANDSDMHRQMIEQLNQQLESKNIELVKLKTHVVELQQTVKQRQQMLTNRQSQRQNYFRQLGQQNDYLRIAINEKEFQLSKINEFLNMKDNVIEQKHTEIIKLQKTIQSQNKSIQNIKIHWSGQLTKAEQQSQIKIIELERNNQLIRNELQQQINKLRQQLGQANEKFLSTSTNEKDIRNKLSILQQKKKHFEEHLSRHREKIHEQTQQISSLQKQLKEKKQEIEKKQKNLEQKNKEIQTLKNKEKEQSALLQKLEKEKSKVKSLQTKFTQLQKKYSEKKLVEKKLNQSEKEIQTLQQKISTFEAKCQTLEQQNKKNVPAFMNMLKIRDFEANQIFEQKIIYQLKAQNEKLRLALSGQKNKSNQVSAKTVFSPKANINVKDIIKPQLSSDNLEYIKARLVEFDQKLNSLIDTKKISKSKHSFLTPQYQEKLNMFRSASKAKEQQTIKEMQRDNQSQQANQNKIKQLQFWLQQLQKYCQSLQAKSKQKIIGKNRGFNQSMALEGLQKQFKQELDYLKSKNAEMQTRINHLIEMNKELKIQLEANSNTSNKLQKDSMIIYYKKEIKQMEQNLQIEKKRVERVSNQYSMMKTQLEEAINEKQQRNQYINKLQGQISFLNNNLSQIQSTSMKQLKMLRELKTQNEFQIQNLQSKNKQLLKKVSNMEFEILQNRNRLQLKQDINDQEIKRQTTLIKRQQKIFIKQIGEHEEKLKEKNKKILELRQQNRRLEQQLNTKQQACSQYKKKLMEFQTMRTLDMQSHKYKQKNQEKASEEIRSLQMKINQLQYQLDCKETQLINIKTKLNRMTITQQQHEILQQNYYGLELQYNRLLQSQNFKQYKDKQSVDIKANYKLFETNFKYLHNLVQQLRQTFEQPISPISNKQRVLPQAILTQLKKYIQKGIEICQA